MAYTTIDDPSAHFQIKLYSGTGSSNSVTNDGNSNMQPDFVWIKERNNAVSHRLFDSSRGVQKRIFSNVADAESTQSNSLTAFNSDGFTLGDGGSVNGGSDTYVAWQWKANGGSRTTFTESGDNPGGGYQANTTAGFSIVDYVGTGATGTVQHGLGTVPKWMMFKNRDTAQTWVVYHHRNTSAPETDILQLESSNATYDGHTYFNDTGPTSSVFTVATSNDLNKDGDNIISYIWDEIQGFSRFGSYKGNGSTDGPIIYTGFRPAWIMIKRTNGTQNWPIFDTKLRPSNMVDNNFLYADLNNAVDTTNQFDILSNGFKLNMSSNLANGNGDTYVYMAFAEQPFVTSKGVPANAR